MGYVLLGKSLSELETFCNGLGFPKFTAGQICKWLYGKRVRDLAAMSNISAKNRQILQDNAVVGCREPIDRQCSEDGTEKYLFPTGEPDAKPAKSVESVYIPDNGRATLCLSCQSGCRMNCGFCATGSQGFNHHLPVHEILNQYYSLPQSEHIGNIVYMGMGEPFDNIDAVLASLEVMTAPWGFAWSPYRITVSTVGILPGLRRFLDESRCHLALSLHNPFPEERASLMPVERTYPIASCIELLHRYPWHNQRRVSFEYILIKGYNDTPGHARAVAGLLRNLECRVNLISCHEVPGKPFRKSSPEATENFQRILRDKGIICTLRKSRGEDIMAACGLLAKTRGEI